MLRRRIVAYVQHRPRRQWRWRDDDYDSGVRLHYYASHFRSQITILGYHLDTVLRGTDDRSRRWFRIRIHINFAVTNVYMPNVPRTRQITDNSERLPC